MPMRFVVTGEWRDHHLLRLILAAFLAYMFLFWVSNALLYFARMSLSYSSVVHYYRGDEAIFLSPRSYLGLLEVTHAHLFAMGILLLTLTHLILFVPLAVQTKAALIVVAFGSALVDEAGGWLTRYVSPTFAYAKIAGFVGVEASLAVMLGLVGHALWHRPTNAYRDGSSLP